MVQACPETEFLLNGLCLKESMLDCRFIDRIREEQVQVRKRKALEPAGIGRGRREVREDLWAEEAVDKLRQKAKIREEQVVAFGLGYQNSGSLGLPKAISATS